MSNIAPIVIETSVGGNAKTYTFGPNGFPAKDLSEYFERSGGVPVGYPRVHITVRRATSSQDPKVTVQLDVPTLAETSPSTGTGIAPMPSRAYNCIGKMEFFIPRFSSAAERDVLLQLVQGLAESSVITEAVKDLNFPY